MDAIGRAHELLARIAPDFAIGVLAGGQVQAQIREAIRLGQDTGRRRACPLHPVLVFWLVLALPLFRALAIPNVFLLLVSGMRSRVRGLPLRPVDPTALAHARSRLGPKPVRLFFEDLASGVRPEPTFFGRRMWVLDGVKATTPDTPENEAAFGRPGASRGQSAWPQVSIVTLAAARTHELRGATWRRCHTGEREEALDLLPLLGPGDLVVMDRGFFAVWFLERVVKRGADFLVRVPADVKPLRKERRGPGDFDVVLFGQHLPRFLRVPGQRPPSMVLEGRMIEYTLDGKETIRLLTSRRSARVTPRDLVEGYHGRWETEIGNDEIKTHLATVGHGTQHTVFRGRSPQMVEQELWATLALYNLVRRLMARAAQLHRLDPRRISFVDSLVVIRDAVNQVHRAAIRELLPLYVRLMEDLATCELDRWRRPRAGPRAVKVKMSNYRRKQPGERFRNMDFLAGLRMGPAA